MNIGRTAARQNPRHPGGPDGIHGIIGPIQTLGDFGFAYPADAHHGNTAGEFCEPLAQIFLLERRVASQPLFRADSNDPLVDRARRAGATDNRRRILGKLYPVGGTQYRRVDLLQVVPQPVRHQRRAGHSGDILVHGPAAVAE